LGLGVRVRLGFGVGLGLVDEHLVQVDEGAVLELAHRWVLAAAQRLGERGQPLGR